MKMKSKVTTRRRFLAGAGTFTFVFTIGGLTLSSRPRESEPRNLNVWITLCGDGKIKIQNPAAEMGQGSMTALAVILAEELDASWDDITIEHAPITPDIYGLQWGGRLGGPMLTVGSRTVRGYFRNLRLAGAQARQILLQTAATALQCDVHDLSTADSTVIHKDGRILPYRDLIKSIDTRTTLPEISDGVLKNVRDFKLIGKVVPRYDIPDKVNGKTIYSIDVHLPDMHYGTVIHCPVNGSKPTLLNEAVIKEMDGFTASVVIPNGVGIIASTFESCLAISKKVEISWCSGQIADNFNSQQALDRYEGEVAHKRSRIIEQKGSPRNWIETESKTSIKAVYKNDFAYHAQMEPLNAVVSVAMDGKSAGAWIGSQAPDRAKSAIATTLKIEEENVTIHPCFLGGGFGRRSLSDYVEDAAALSNHIRKPVKMIWTREEDFSYGAFRPSSMQLLEAGIDVQGMIGSWIHHTVGTGDGLLVSGVGISYYDIPNIELRLQNIDHGIRTKHWRSVGHGPNKWAIEAFIDEVAGRIGADPYEYRMLLLEKEPRGQKVLQTVAAMSGWGEPSSEGRAKGIAFAERSGALTASVAEISVDSETGRITVHAFYTAMDAGIVVQPDNALAQLEGGLLFGLSSVLYESISFEKGQVEQSNFHHYPLLRFEDTPPVMECTIIESEADPAGVGEASTPVVGGAIANAFLALTGKSLRHMPFTRERVIEALS